MSVPTPDLPATGDCYQTAAGYMLDKAPKGAVMIHGRPTLRRPPWCEFGHAWIELADGTVYDPETGYRGDKNLYYVLGNIDPDDNLAYTRELTRKALLSFGHFGPWEGPDAHGPVDDFPGFPS